MTNALGSLLLRELLLQVGAHQLKRVTLQIATRWPLLTSEDSFCHNARAPDLIRGKPRVGCFGQRCASCG